MDYREDLYPKIPFYMAYPASSMYLTEMEYEKDIERMKQWYPKEVQRIQRMVDERCDELEYEGSRLFDEEPDRNMMRMEAMAIYQKIVDELPMESSKEEVPVSDKKLYFEGFSDFQLKAASCDFGRRCNDWLSNIVEILFYNEAYRRRCRHRRCRRWW